jgi:hypothetical protein
MIRAGVAAVGVSGLLVLLTWTMLTDAAHLINDFPSDSWLMQHQAASLRESHVPSLSLTANAAAFYPAFAFYGGTLFVFGGAITLLTGSADAAQIIMYLLALASAYGGWLWLARLAGLRSWPSHAPAILYVTAAYTVTNINVRQDLAEIVATSAIPPLVASALSVLRAERLRAGPAGALAASTIAFGGSHNLTLLWGTTILAIAGLAVAAGVPQARRQVSRHGALRVLAVVAPALAVNGWYLLPDLAYHSDTVIAQRIGEWKELLRGSHPEVGVKSLFALGRSSAIPGVGLVLTLPVLAMGWVAAVALTARAQWHGTWVRILAVLALLTTGVLVMVAHPRWLLALPDPWLMIQFSFRLMTFAVFGICGAVIAALVLVNRGGYRWLTGLLLPILMISVIEAAVQRQEAPRSKSTLIAEIDRYVPFNAGDFAGMELDQRSPGASSRTLILVRADVRRGQMVRDLRASPGDLIYTNLMTPARMLEVEGARIVGRWPGPPAATGWQTRWGLVLQIDGDAVPGKAHIEIRQARSSPIVAGRIISLFGLLGLAMNAVVMVRAARRRRRVSVSAGWHSRVLP